MTAIVNWRKSSRSTSQSECVEVGSWRKSTRSNGQAECVEVRTVEQIIAVRDTKDRSGPALTFASTAWSSFVDHLQGR